MRAIGRRSLTIYLWHTAAIIVAVNVLEARRIDEPVAHAIGLVLLTTLGIVVATRLFGWVEDVAAGRRRPAPRTEPAAGAVAAPPPRSPAGSSEPFALHRRLAAAVVVLLTAGLLATSASHRAATPESEAAARPARRPPIPSKPPPAPVFRTDEAVAKLQSREAEDRLVAGLDALAKEWVARTGMGGSLLGVAVGPDIRWTAATGTRGETGVRTTVNDRIDLASLTKLYTATLVHQAADAGLVDLSAPSPTCPSCRTSPTTRALPSPSCSTTAAGSIPTCDTARVHRPLDLFDTPLAAIWASLRPAAAAAPGDGVQLLEHQLPAPGPHARRGHRPVARRPFREAIFSPLGLRDTVHRPPIPGEPRGGTAGIETDRCATC